MTRILLAISILALAGIVSTLPAGPHHEHHAATDDGDGELVAHEWGTFTAIAGVDGTALEWRPLLGTSDLPSFVYTVSQQHIAKWACRGKGCPARLRMETPVIYFYSDIERTVSVRARFFDGAITEWFPRAVRDGDEIYWPQVSILPKADEPLPRETADSHYYPARNTSAAQIMVTTPDGDKQYDKFLFYRGIGMADQPLGVTMKGKTLELRSASDNALGKIIVFERDGEELRFRSATMAGKKLTVKRPTKVRTLGALEKEVQGMLVDAGLYEDEAAAMLDTWRGDWFEDGLRVLYLLPREDTDTMLPLTIEPKPDKVVRVMVGRVEVITPELRETLEAQIGALSCATVSGFFRSDNARYGEAILREQLASATDEATIKRLRQLLGDCAL